MDGRINWADYFEEIRKARDYDPECTAGQITRMLIKRHPDDFGNVKMDSMRRYLSNLLKSGKLYEEADGSISDKKVPEKVNWREMKNLVQQTQRLKKRISGSQNFLNRHIKTKKPICIMVLGDTQLGSFGTDYDLFEKLTDQIVNTPNLYVIIVGDIIQMAIKMRGLAEVLDNAISPDMQLMWLESWLEEIEHKVIASTWDNHSSMREEKVIGYSRYGQIFSKKVPFFNGIGHINLKVGNETYKIAASHFFRGKSMYNKAHAPMRYMREKANNIEIAVQGDFHQPGILMQEFGGVWRLSIVCGSIQTDSTYAKRFFSLETLPNMPCFTLHPKKHLFNAYATVGHFLNSQ